RKRSDAVAAAADYNRALAYAPNDPSLLKVVASMQRSEARARLVRKAAPLVVGALVLGSGAYLVASAIKDQGDDTPRPAPVKTKPSATVAAKGASTPSPPRSARPVASSATPTSSASVARVAATPTVVSTASKS